jgi:hypothetical protein
MIHFHVFYHVSDSFVVGIFTNRELFKSPAHQQDEITVGNSLTMNGLIVENQVLKQSRRFVSISRTNPWNWISTHSGFHQMVVIPWTGWLMNQTMRLYRPCLLNIQRTNLLMRLLSRSFPVHSPHVHNTLSKFTGRRLTKGWVDQVQIEAIILKNCAPSNPSDFFVRQFPESTSLQ